MRFSKGDPVQVTYEGIVVAEHPLEGLVAVRGPGDQVTYLSTSLIEPVAQYVHDAIYQDSGGKIWRYTNNNGNRPWIQIVPWIGIGIADKEPLMPVRRMRPEGYRS